MIPLSTLVEKTAGLVKNGQRAKKRSAIKWKRLQADLEALYPAQQNLVIRLIAQMKATNKEDLRAEKQARKNGS